MLDPDTASTAPGPDRGRGLRSGLVAAGAALGMTLAGLGIAGAQTSSTTTTTAPPAGAARPAGGHQGCAGHPRAAAVLSTAARAIGVGEADLRTALGEGRSMAAVAGDRGVAVGTVVDALVAEARARLEQAVTAGRITRAEADRRAAGLPARMTAVVHREGRPGHPGRPGHHRGGAGDGPAGAPMA